MIKKVYKDQCIGLLSMGLIGLQHFLCTHYITLRQKLLPIPPTNYIYKSPNSIQQFKLKFVDKYVCVYTPV